MTAGSNGVKYLSREEWTSQVAKQRSLFFNEQPEVVELLCNIYGFTPLYIVYHKKSNVVISFIALSKDKSICLPIHFFYSFIWISDKLSDTSSCMALTAFLKDLKKKFNSITIKLPHHFNDIRPFLWTGFKVENRFTYLKDLDGSVYSKDVNKNISAWSEKDFTFKKEDLNDEILQLNIDIFREFGVYPKFKIAQIEQLIQGMARVGYVTCFSCYAKGELLVSHILFVDFENKLAYTVLKNKFKEHRSGSLHTILYHELFKELGIQGYRHVDLLGADMEGISLFKSRFQPKLYAVDILRYSKTAEVYGTLLASVKNQLRKLMVKLGL